MTETHIPLPHIVMLVHGIRDFALWQNSIKVALEAEGFQVEPVNYGRFNVLQFLLPIGYFRKKAIEKVWRQVRIIKQNNTGARISVIAHSFGTYVIANLMAQEFDIKFHRIIFCGSVVEYDFPFEGLQNRFDMPIVNDVGTRDVWPAVAESVTVGFGSAGTYGFRRALVKDRWHNGAHHGFFLNSEFCKRFWIPFLQNGNFVPGVSDPEDPSGWIKLVSVFKIKYVLAFLLSAFVAGAIYANAEVLGRLVSWPGAVSVVIPDPHSVGTVEDLSFALKEIESKKGKMTRDKIKSVSAGLTAILIPTTSVIPRVTRRNMNELIVKTIVLLNDKDLSDVWRKLPVNLDLAALNLRDINLTGVRFEGAFLIYADFRGSRLDDAVFSGAFVRHADFEDASLSNVVFERTDWYNSIDLLADHKGGWPIPFAKWFSCPKDYWQADRTSFIQAFNRSYGTRFEQLKPDDAETLKSKWADYARDGGLCDRVPKRQ